MDNTNHELYHYGVVGMKWGIRKAKKQGTTYNYKSHGQKKYEKKIAKLQAKGANEKSIAKAQGKLDLYKVRDRNRQSYVETTSLGKSFAKQIVFGPIGSGNYERMRAAGHGRIASAFVSNWIASTVGAPVTVLATRSMEKATARSELRGKERSSN